MQRRTLIKNLALLLGGIALIPSCIEPDRNKLVKLKHISLNQEAQDLISEICETLIPKTNTPGAKDLHLPEFVLKMIDDGYNQKDQNIFLKGMGEFTQLVEKRFHREYTALTKQEKESFLITIEKESQKTILPFKAMASTLTAAVKTKIPVSGQKVEPDRDPIHKFYRMIKGETLFGYTTSQYFMTKEVVYELVPGRYKVHFPINQKKIA